MSGKTCHILLLLLLLTGGWRPLCAAQPGRSGVVLVLSSANPEYRLAVGAFRAALRESGQPVALDERTLPAGRTEDAAQDSFWNSVRAANPALVLSVGTPAARAALRRLQDTPLAFTMVLGDPFREAPAGARPPVFGLSLSLGFREQLEAIRESLPLVRRVGFLATSGSGAAPDSLRRLSDELGLRLVEARLGGKEEVLGALKGMLEGIDLLWLPPDPLTYSQDVSLNLLEFCYLHRVPVFAFSRQLALAGAPLSLGSDYAAVGAQTAEMTLQFLFPESKSQTSAGVQTVRSVLLYVNQPVAESLGLHIPRRVLSRSVILGAGTDNR
ncbi:hypothetical protein LLH00_14655 [bacterium]|nr:hypothetical protein [bacterium]